MSTRRRVQVTCEIDNPPLGYLVNLSLALGVELDEVIEDESFDWLVLDARAAKPP